MKQANIFGGYDEVSPNGEHAKPLIEHLEELTRSQLKDQNPHMIPLDIEGKIASKVGPSSEGVQDTSVNVWRSLGEKYLGDAQKKVYRAMRRWQDSDFGGHMSNEEIGKVTNLPINQVTPRTYELRELGLVVWTASRKLSNAGKTVRTMRALPEEDQIRVLHYRKRHQQEAQSDG